MYIHKFITVDDTWLALNVEIVEAVLEKPEGTVIITNTDTFYVKAKFQDVVNIWLTATSKI